MFLCHNIELYFYAATLWKHFFFFFLVPAVFLSITCFYLAFVSIRFFRNWSWSGVRNKLSGDKLSSALPYYRFYSKHLCRAALRAHTNTPLQACQKRVKMHGWCRFCTALCLALSYLLWCDPCFMTTMAENPHLSAGRREGATSCFVKCRAGI